MLAESNNFLDRAKKYLVKQPNMGLRKSIVSRGRTFQLVSSYSRLDWARAVSLWLRKQFGASKYSAASFAWTRVIKQKTKRGTVVYSVYLANDYFYNKPFKGLRL